MRAASLVELNRIELIDVPIPEVEKDTDVQVQVKAAGICGTDLHMFREARADVQLPRIMGHELAGLVTKIGRAVTRVSVGDRVVLDPVFACGNCPTCQKGHPNVCDNVRCYGVQMDGGFQDYIVVDEDHLYAFDPSISYEEAALAEPFSIAVNILEQANITSGDNLLIVGGGTIGLSVLQVAKGLGANVMLTDIIPEKLAIAKQMGANAVVSSKFESLSEAASAFAPIGFDVLVDAVGVAPILQQCIDLAAPRARIVCIGFDTRPAEISPVKLTKKELTIVGSRMNCRRFPTVIKKLTDRKIDAAKMISKKYAIDNIQTAFEETLADNTGNVKTLLLF